MEVDFHHRQYHTRSGADVTVRSFWKVVQGKCLSSCCDLKAQRGGKGDEGQNGDGGMKLGHPEVQYGSCYIALKVNETILGEKGMALPLTLLLIHSVYTYTYGIWYIYGI